MPSRAVRIRDQQRTLLGVHLLALVAGLTVSFLVNRHVSPDRLWALWVAVAWGAVFAGHLAVFARATIATMGGRKD